MGAALASWAAAAAAFALAPRRSLARLAGRATLTLAVILYPTTLQHAATLVHCEAVTLATSALQSLDGGGSLLASGSGSSGGGAAAPLVATPLLASNPFFVCWAPGGSHRPAGVLACVVLALYCAALPLTVLAWLRAQLPARGGTAAAAGGKRAAVDTPPPPPVIASAVTGTKTPGSAVTDPLPDPILAPFLSDFRPGVWAAKHVDLTLLMLLALLEALLQRPASAPLIAAKAVLTCSGMVAVAAYALAARPFPAAAAWKLWVRVGLLTLGAGCAVVNAVQAAADLGAGGPALAGCAAAAAYILFAGVCVVFALLVAGFYGTLVRTAVAEQQQQRQHGRTEVGADSEQVFDNPLRPVLPGRPLAAVDASTGTYAQPPDGNAQHPEASKRAFAAERRQGHVRVAHLL